MPESPSPILRFKLENIGPIKSAEVELGRVAILYGTNATGKTTVARALAYIIKVLNGFNIRCSGLLDLIGAPPRDSTEGSAAMVALGGYEVSLRRPRLWDKVAVSVKKGGEVLYSGECSGGAVSTGLHVGGDLGVDLLVWVKYDKVLIVDANSSEVALSLRGLLNPSIARRYITASISGAKAASDFEDYVLDVSHALSSVAGWHVTNQQGSIYFINGVDFYEPSNVAGGIRRAVLILTAKVLMERARRLGRLPLIFVEGLEPLHIDLINGILDAFEDSGVPIVVETHNAFALKYAALRNWNAYVLKDGYAYTDLARPELFASEAAVTSEVGGIL
jgi:ABC-type branched-subunit amino acid transport system ATPase component